MVKEALTRISWKKGSYGYIYLPYKIVLDSAFPFPRGPEPVEVKLRIADKKLVISLD